MNQFIILDKNFPVLPNRLSGEVVSVTVNLTVNDHSVGVISWKRKAWYVNASTNAFILHRKLCAELVEHLDRFTNIGPFTWHLKAPTKEQLKKAKKLLAIAVWNSYVLNCTTGEQYHEWLLQLCTKDFNVLGTSADLWWNSQHENGESRSTSWNEVSTKWKFPSE